MVFNFEVCANWFYLLLDFDASLLHVQPKDLANAHNKLHSSCCQGGGEGVGVGLGVGDGDGLGVGVGVGVGVGLGVGVGACVTCVLTCLKSVTFRVIPSPPLLRPDQD